MAASSFICPFAFSHSAFPCSSKELFPPSVTLWSGALKSVKILGLVFFAVSFTMVAQGIVFEKSSGLEEV